MSGYKCPRATVIRTILGCGLWQLSAIAERKVNTFIIIAQLVLDVDEHRERMCGCVVGRGGIRYAPPLEQDYTDYRRNNMVRSRDKMHNYISD